MSRACSMACISTGNAGRIEGVIFESFGMSSAWPGVMVKYFSADFAKISTDPSRTAKVVTGFSIFCKSTLPQN